MTELVISLDEPVESECPFELFALDDVKGTEVHQPDEDLCALYFLRRRFSGVP